MHPTKDASVHQTPPGGRQHTVAPVHQRLGHDRDARNTIDARRRAYNDSREGAKRGYHPQHGGCYDSGEDRSLSPGLSGPQAFGRHILNATSRQGIDRLPISLNILGKQTPGFGSKTIGLPVKPVVRMMMILLFAISHYSWPIRRELGWSTYRPTPFRVGWT